MIQGKQNIKSALKLFWVVAAILVGAFLVGQINKSQDITSRASRDTEVLPGDDVLSLQKDLDGLTEADSLFTLSEADLAE